MIVAESNELKLLFKILSFIKIITKLADELIEVLLKTEATVNYYN